MNPIAESAAETPTEFDEQLLRLLGRCAASDASALQRLYELVSPILFACLTRILRRRALAEEALQDVFVSIWQRAGQFSATRGRPMAWMVSIARYRAIDLLRHERHVPALVPDLPERLAAPPEAEPEGDSPAWLPRSGLLEHCLGLLTERQKHCLELAFVSGNSHEDISRLTGSPLGTVKSWIRRGLQSLRQCLEGGGDVKPVNPELVDRLAAEYVLGTLRGPARRRIERWRASTPHVDQRCRHWEEHLMHLAKGLKPVQPPAHVWVAIRERLNLTPQRSARRWTRSLALAASVVLVAGLAGLLYWHSLPGVRATAFSTISAKSGEAMWQVEVFGTTNRLVVQAAKLPARPAGNDYELWALPKGGNPVSLGVLPAAGTSTRTLTAIQKAALASSSQVAVSIEPRGGSPTGQPTGEVVFMAPLRTSG